MNNISIIIPTFNRLDTLKKVLPSYVTQKHVKEIIVIDDCSSDDTYQYMKSFSKMNSKVIYFRNPKNIGQPSTQNLGVKISSAEYVFIGEDDLELPKNYFVTLLKHMHDEKADIIAGRRLWLQKGESKKDALYRHNKSTGRPFDRTLLITDCGIKLENDIELPLVDASMLIKKGVFKNVAFDNYYSKTAWREETDFQLMALIKGYKIIYCPHVYNYHLYKERNKGGNHSHSILIYELSIFRNNLYMARKYWSFLQKEFDISYLFFLRFTYYRLSRSLVGWASAFKKHVLNY
jgi:GT2 family glycosyltransferase